MKIIIRNRMLLVVLVLSMSMCLTGCLPGYTLWLTTLEEDSEEEIVEEEAEKEEEEKKIQIRNLEGITLDNQEATLPCNIIMYDDATKASENSVRIHLKEDEERIITFLFTKGEDFSVSSVSKGIILEENEKCSGCYSWNIETVGDIQTFSLNFPITSKPSTVVYQIHNGKDYYDNDDRFIAFYLIPPDSSETEN